MVVEARAIVTGMDYIERINAFIVKVVETLECAEAAMYV